jgi:hypothetical protein
VRVRKSLIWFRRAGRPSASTAGARNEETRLYELLGAYGVTAKTSEPRSIRELRKKLREVSSNQFTDAERTAMLNAID